MGLDVGEMEQVTVFQGHQAVIEVGEEKRHQGRVSPGLYRLEGQG